MGTLTSFPPDEAEPAGTPAPPWNERLLAVLFYFGLAPWLWRVCLRGEKFFLKRHFSQALTIAWLLLIVLLFYLLTYALTAYLLVEHRDFYRTLSQSVLFWLVTNVLPQMLAVVWTGLWVVSIAFAVRGSDLEIPVVGRLARSRTVISMAFAVSSPIYLAMFLVVGVAFHATTLTEERIRPAPVYMLYDDLGHVPHWLFDLGFYRMARRATSRWGKGSVVVAPLSVESLDAAFQNGRFVFIASHGSEGKITTAKLRYGPEDVGRTAIGKNLKLVYIAACEGGALVDDWQDALAPAEVVAFERESYIDQHVYWLWFKGPSRIADLE